MKVGMAERLNRLGANFFADLGDRLMALRAKGVDVIRLDEGSPDMPPALAAKKIDAFIVADTFNAFGELKAGGKMRTALGSEWGRLFRNWDEASPDEAV